MKRYLPCGLLLTMLFLTSAPMASAKPGELPAENQIQCPECGEEKPTRSLSIKLGIGSGGITLEVEARQLDEPAPPAAIDTVTPVYVEQLLKAAGAAFAGRGGAANADQERQAARLFGLAEWYSRTGHLGAARLCFQHVHMLSPTTRLGRLAIDRLLQIEERLRDASEPAEEPGNVTPRESFRRLRERTMPLGLVEVSY